MTFEDKPAADTRPVRAPQSLSSARLRGIAWVAGLAAAAASLAAMPAQASTAFSNVNNLNTGQCLDNDTNNDGRLQMWQCDGGDDEQWLYFRSGGQVLFVDRRTGLCATAPVGWGAPVTMTRCSSGAANQLWHAYRTVGGTTTASWQNDASGGFCLWAAGTQNGANPVLGHCFETGDSRLYWHKQ